MLTDNSPNKLRSTIRRLGHSVCVCVWGEAGLRTLARTESYFATQSKNISSIASPAFIIGHHVPPLGSTSILHWMHFSTASILPGLPLPLPPVCILPSLHLPPIPHYTSLHSMYLSSACISLLQASLLSKHLSKPVYPVPGISPKAFIFPIYSTMCLLPACISPQQASFHQRASPTENPSRIAWVWCQLYGSVDKTLCHASLMTWVPASEPMQKPK